MKINNFTYGAFHFVPYGNLRSGVTLGEINFGNRTELRLWDDYFMQAYGEVPSQKYTHSSFYEASGDSDKDIFLCLENLKLYIPTSHELMEFCGYRGKKKRRKEKAHE